MFLCFRLLIDPLVDGAGHEVGNVLVESRRPDLRIGQSFANMHPPPVPLPRHWFRLTDLLMMSQFDVALY